MYSCTFATEEKDASALAENAMRTLLDIGYRNVNTEQHFDPPRIKLDFEAHSDGHIIGLELDIVPLDRATYLYFSFYPLTSLNLPELFPSEEEKARDDGRMRILLDSIIGTFKGKGMRLTARHLPQRATYEINASGSAIAEALVSTIKEIGYKLRSYSISVNAFKVTAVNRSTLSLLLEEYSIRGFAESKYDGLLAKNQKFVIKAWGKRTDDKWRVVVSVKPYMELLGLEEIPGLTEGLDEQLTDAEVSELTMKKMIDGIRNRLGVEPLM